MDLRTIVVTWRDGETATYGDAAASVREGVLHITIYNSPRGIPVDEWHFPTTSIRAWGPRQWQADDGGKGVA